MDYKNSSVVSPRSLELTDNGMILTLEKAIGPGKLLDINTGSTYSHRLQ